MTTEPHMIRQTEAARILGVSVRTLRNLQHRGVIPRGVQYVPHGPRYVERAAVEAVAAGRREAGR